MFYTARHKARRRYNHVYSDCEHPVLCYLASGAVTLAVTTLFMLIAFM